MAPLKTHTTDEEEIHSNDLYLGNILSGRTSAITLLPFGPAVVVSSVILIDKQKAVQSSKVRVSTITSATK